MAEKVVNFSNRGNKPKPAAGLSVKNKGNKTGEIYLYGVIGETWYGDGVSAKTFSKELKALGSVTTIDLHLNSEGGVVTDARAMYNLLVQHPATVNVYIDALAASAASFLAMAGDKIAIAEGAIFMIHNARGVAIGEEKDMLAYAETLRTFNRTIIDTYVARTGIAEKKVRDWMDAETYFDGKQALENGFATEVMKNKVAATACLSGPKSPFLNMAKLPRELRPNRAKVTDLLALCK